MCQECDPSTHGVGYVIALGILLGLATAALGLWWVVERINNDFAP